MRATGYPVQDTKNSGAAAYRELPGLLLPLVPNSLEGGMRLAYTSAVLKGMSGGGLFDEQGRLVGINTTHPDPLWEKPLRYENGKLVPDHLNRQLELVALGIPIDRILPLLNNLAPPSLDRSASPDTSKSTARASQSSATLQRVQTNNCEFSL